MVIAAFLGAVLAALFTYYITHKLNNESSVQQQYVASVQDFAATGARVDAAVTDLADATVDKEGVDQAKKEARQAIAAHAAATLALRPIIGKGNVQAYMQGVAQLRQLVDSTGDVPAALRTSKGRFALIDNRNQIIAVARKNIYG
jgi:predicted ArsR family transcriptional regulator